MKRKPWDQQEKETSKAFAAFCVYRDMGPKRSLVKVGRKVGKVRGYVLWLERWSSKHDWVARCRSWDEHQDRRRRKVKEKAERKAIENMVEDYAATAALAHSIVQSRLMALKNTPGAKIPASLIKLFEAACKIERLSRGEPTDIQERTKVDKRPLGEVTDEELHRILGSRSD